LVLGPKCEGPPPSHKRIRVGMSANVRCDGLRCLEMLQDVGCMSQGAGAAASPRGSAVGVQPPGAAREEAAEGEPGAEAEAPPRDREPAPSDPEDVARLGDRGRCLQQWERGGKGTGA